MKKTLLCILVIYSSFLAAQDPTDSYAIEVEEVTASETLGDSKPARRYQIKCKNYPLECSAMLVQEFLGGKISSVPAYLREDGVVAMRREGYPTYYLTDEALGSAEAVTLNLLLCDRLRTEHKAPVYASYKFIPHPVEVVGSCGVVLSCEAAEVSKKTFFIRVVGLTPSEEVQFRTTQDQEAMEFNESANEEGQIIFVVESSEGSNEVTASNERIGTMTLRY